MAEVAGYDGYVESADGVVVTGMKSWTCPQLANVGDITDFQSSGLKEFKLTLKEWGGTFEGSLDGTPLTLGTTYELHLGLAGTTEYYGDSIITNSNVSMLLSQFRI